MQDTAFPLSKSERFLVSVMCIHKLGIAKKQSVPLVLPWRVLAEEKMVARKEIQKEDEDILVQFGASFFVGELTKYSSAWVTRYLNANEIYIISTTVDVDFNVAVYMMFAFADTEGELIDVRTATQGDRSFRSLFPRNGTHIILEYTDELRSQVAESSNCEIKLLLSTGLMNAHPVLVTVQLRRHSEDQTSMEIKGFSKEGWMIRWHAGRKMAYLVAQRIEEQLSL
ncbi:hypothetical protein [Dictyobacter arantiisoli]|uniref:Uncharacterized protein n=1 Tax=Dictyobacter arantiisoli TaxID=2014874 RepID=A0A5A5THU9_9CHLR|nr:hypothetical protein [Dictyobacter arantiisoli]GCF10716.1 hypothetical protein KDI_42800 [Dictyobacter arantiisoli]